MKKGYQSPKAEKINFQYAESVVASVSICKSGLTKVYTDTGIPNCATTYVRTEAVWNGDNLG